MTPYFHVIRVTQSRGRRARYELATVVDSWGSGTLQLAIHPGEGPFYSPEVAHARAFELSKELHAAVQRAREAV